MEINFTLIIQMLVFFAFVWFTMKFVWPPLEKALQERQDKIADGLAAAERGHREFELAQHRIKDELKQAKLQSADLVEKANRRAVQLVEEAKINATGEAKKIAKLAEEQLSHEVTRAKIELKNKVASLAIASAEKILRREIDEKTNFDLINHLIEEL